MDRIIKAYQVQMGISPQKRMAHSAVVEEPMPAPGDEPNGESELQQAYDELIMAAQEEVALILEDARAEAQGILQQAEQAATDAHRRIHEEAYAQGMRQARQEVEDLFARAQDEIDRTLGEAQAQRDNMLNSLEPQFFKMALEVAEKILGYELDHNDNAFLSMLKSALGSVKSETHVTLRVNPSEYVRFFKSREVTMHTKNGSITAQVINDPTVGYGGCLIETESGAIDAGAQAQLRQIQQNLGFDE